MNDDTVTDSSSEVKSKDHDNPPPSNENVESTSSSIQESINQSESPNVPQQNTEKNNNMNEGDKDIQNFENTSIVPPPNNSPQSVTNSKEENISTNQEKESNLPRDPLPIEAIENNDKRSHAEQEHTVQGAEKEAMEVEEVPTALPRPEKEIEGMGLTETQATDIEASNKDNEARKEKERETTTRVEEEARSKESESTEKERDSTEKKDHSTKTGKLLGPDPRQGMPRSVIEISHPAISNTKSPIAAPNATNMNVEDSATFVEDAQTNNGWGNDTRISHSLSNDDNANNSAAEHSRENTISDKSTT